MNAAISLQPHYKPNFIGQNYNSTLSWVSSSLDLLPCYGHKNSWSENNRRYILSFLKRILIFYAWEAFRHCHDISWCEIWCTFQEEIRIMMWFINCYFFITPFTICLFGICDNQKLCYERPIWNLLMQENVCLISHQAEPLVTKEKEQEKNWAVFIDV